MADPRAQRTLVKSPPELWAEVSDVTALARHLGEFGEIRITRLEPETTVAWEGDTARGTVELQASGWGTKVTLTAELVAAVPPVEPEPVAVEPEPEPVAVEPEPQPEPVVVEPEPVAVEPEPASVPAVADAVDEGPLDAPEPKLGFFARLFGRKPKPAPAPIVAVEPEPEPVPEPVAVEPEPVAAEPEPVAVEPEPALVPDEPEAPEGELRTGEPVAAPAVDHDAAVAVLTSVLDDLGSAHHRPFSRS